MKKLFLLEHNDGDGGGGGGSILEIIKGLDTKN